MPVPPRAQMTNSGSTWHLYIAFPDRLSTQWPEYDWMRSAPVPTLAEREQALNGLGYEIPPGAEWSWIEDSDTPDDPASPVLLMTAVTIRPTTDGGAR